MVFGLRVGGVGCSLARSANEDIKVDAAIGALHVIEEEAGITACVVSGWRLPGSASPLQFCRRDIEMQVPFAFTKDCQTMKIAARRQPLWIPFFETLLFDTEADPGQLAPVEDAAVEAEMVDRLVDLMRANDAPPEQYERVGLA